MRAMILPVLLLLLYMWPPAAGQGNYELLVCLDAKCGCSYSVHEQTGSIQVCVDILYVNGTATTTSPYNVTLTTTGGSAQSGVDYTPLSSFTLTFPEGSAQGDSQCTTITITDDDAVETTESFTVSLETNDPLVEIYTILSSAPISITDTDVITVGVTESSFEQSESDGAVEVCLNITNGRLEIGVSSSVNTQSVTATGTSIATGSSSIISDYQSISSFVQFSSGQSVGDESCTSVTIFDDTRVEDDEDFLIVFGNYTHVTVSSEANSARIVILDNDVAVIGMLSAGIFQTEDSVDAIVCAVLLQSQGLEITLSAYVETQTMTATGGRDYNEVNNLGISFFSGDLNGAERCTSIRINEDTILEYNETFQVVLMENSSRLEVDSSRTTTQVTIVEDDDEVSIGFQSLQFLTTEGSSATVEICAQIDAGTLERSVSVYISTANQTATDDADYGHVTSQELMFIPGQSFESNTTSCLDLGIIDDSILEGREMFSVIMTSSATEVVITDGRAQAGVLIEEDSSDVVDIGFPTGQPLTVTEGNEGTISVCLEILGGVLERDVTVFVTTSDITATGSSDYSSIVSQEAIFTSGQATSDRQCISIPILDDNNVLEEAVETFEVLVTTNDSAVAFPLGQDRATVNISEDTLDGVTIGLQETSYSTAETGGPLGICAQMFLGNLERNVSMTLVSSDGTAVAPGDYDTLNTQLVFTPGLVSGAVVCADLQVVNDNVVEENEESLGLTLSADDPPVTTTTAVSANVTIRENDNDGVQVQPSASGVAASEGGAGAGGSGGDLAVEVCIELATGSLQRNLSVNVRTIASPTSTATVNEDYLDIDVIITFTSGQNATDDNQQCVSIPILDDNVLEGNETFDLLVSPTPEDENVVNITGQVITVTIEEDNSDFVEVGLLPLSFSVNENETFPVCVTLTNGTLERNITVTLEVESGSANEGVDFIGPEPSVVTFTPGQSAGDIQCANITIPDDSIPQGERKFIISVSSGDGSDGSGGGDGGGGGGVHVNPDFQSIEIDIAIDIDDGAVIQVSLSQLVYEATESPGAEVSICVVIELGSVSNDTSVQLITPLSTASTATPVLDYMPISEVLEFTEGLSVGDSVCTPIMIVEDQFVEERETFEVMLLPVLEDFYKVLILPGKERAIVTISDGEMFRSVDVTPSFSDVVATEGIDRDGRDDTSGSGISKVMVCLQLASGSLQRNVSVNVKTTSSPTATATVNEDYLDFDMNITFTSGQNDTGDNLQCISISLIDDNVLEGNETFNLLITPTPEDEGIVNVINGLITVTIQEDPSDNVRIGLTDARFTVTESVDSSITLCAELQEGCLQRNLSVAIMSEASNATAGVDYRIQPENLTFTSGQRAFDGIMRCATVEILDDEDTEHREILTFFLAPADPEDANAIVTSPANNLTTINIIEDPNDEVQISPNASVLTVAEGASATFCLGISLGSLQREIQIHVRSIAGIASRATPGEDFSVIAETVTLTSNEPICSNISIMDDDILEECEAFFISFEVDTTVSGVAVVPKDVDKTIIVIVEDLMDGVEVGFNQSEVVVSEGTSAVALLCAEITSGTLDREITVYLEADNSTTSSAVAGQDYEHIGRRKLVFGPTSTTICTYFNILDDTALESTQNFTVSMAVAAEDSAVVRFSAQKATVLILDDPTDGIVVGLSWSAFNVSEESGSVTVCIELLEGLLETEVSVLLETEQSDSAAPSEDYTSFSEEVLISGRSPGSLTCVNITIVDDSVAETLESFTVALSQPSTGVTISSSGVKSRVDIIDTDKTAGSSSSQSSTIVAIVVPIMVILIVVAALAIFIIFQTVSYIYF